MNDVLSQVAAAAALIVVFIALSIASPYFLTANNLFNVCVQIAVIAIIAVGQTMVIITAGIDLSVGSVAGLSGVMGDDGDVELGHADRRSAILVGVLIGGARRRWSTACSSRRPKLPPFIATLGMMGVARGLTFIVSGVGGDLRALRRLPQRRRGADRADPAAAAVPDRDRRARPPDALAHAAGALRVRDRLQRRTPRGCRASRPRAC